MEQEPYENMLYSEIRKRSQSISSIFKPTTRQVLRLGPAVGSRDKSSDEYGPSTRMRSRMSESAHNLPTVRLRSSDRGYETRSNIVIEEHSAGSKMEAAQFFVD